MDEEEERERQIIKETLEDCVELGLIEVVGINDVGEWLYSATEKGLQVLNSAEGYESAFNAIVDAREDDED